MRAPTPTMRFSIIMGQVLRRGALSVNSTVVAEDSPATIVTAERVEHVFGLRCLIVPDLVDGTPQVFPLGRDRSS